MRAGDPGELPVLIAATLIEGIRHTYRGLPDGRRGGNNQRYTPEASALSAFAVFFTQSPSFLDYQVRMQKARGRNNAESWFGVHPFPSDPQIRNRLDPVAPRFIDTLEALDRLGELEGHRALGGGLLIALDGTEYFTSEAISCPPCSPP
jgi:hypothetical protein